VHSLEDLKRQCLKPEKKLQSAEQRGGRGRKGSLAGLWRKRGGGAGTKTPTTTTEAESPTAMQKTGEEEGSMEGEGTEDDDEGPNGEEQPTRRRLSTLLRRTISLSSNRGPSVSKNADTDSGGRRNTYDFGTPARAVSAGEARVDGEEGGKGRLRRRRSGR
ncbi:MAG: hypothetical protein LQ352_007819, partial [Teloschistes flavicans]